MKYGYIIALSILLTFPVLGCQRSNAEYGNKNEKQQILEKEDRTIAENTKIYYNYRNGNAYLNKYQYDKQVNEIILIEQSGVYNAKLYLLKKDENYKWRELLSCDAILGKNGINKMREGDLRTPTGDYGFTMAFGAKTDPGSKIDYIKLNNTMYLCGDEKYYNKFIDVKNMEHRCSAASEHLLDYIPQYNYALFIDYNKECIYGKGSAIFLHCRGNSQYTLGCIGIDEENMVRILKEIDKSARICIY